LRRAGLALGGIVALYLVLMIPDCAPAPASGAGRTPFVWDRDEFFSELESRFDRARARGCDAVAPELESARTEVEAQLAALEAAPFTPGDERLDQLEQRFFELAPLYGACPGRIEELASLRSRIRTSVKRASAGWDMSSGEARSRLYRLLYGARGAVEEIVLQAPGAHALALSRGVDEPSETPSAVVHGVRVHSGDVLVSRGGAPTSALIARGNDYPGNFSHIALAYVDRDGVPWVIESHIEVGVVVSSLERYLSDTKLRILVLRVRSDLPEVRRDAELPHRAAKAAYEHARAGHIPYDFAMDYDDASKQFCSEVASSAYAAEGVDLWEGLTSMSSPGVVRWLSSFGVERFETHGPSDLEYDPKLVVVAEWHDPETLYADHSDNAVTDVLLEGAEAGESLDYDPWLLPVARVLKGYSVVRNWFGGVGPIPEGMSATVALRAEALRALHGRVLAELRPRLDRFERERGYRPPYWQMVRLAREAKAASE
jgi:hypothetical protein